MLLEGDYCQLNEDFSSSQSPEPLSPFLEDMTEDFNQDPELTIFSVLDGEGIEF